MKNKNLLLLVVAGVAGYFIVKKISANNGGTGAGGGYVFDLAPAEAPINQNMIAESKIETTQAMQAAIDSGDLNIFGQPQSLNLPNAPFTTQYNELVAQAVAQTGSTNIASAENVVLSSLPNLGAIASSIRSAAAEAGNNAAAANSVIVGANGPQSVSQAGQAVFTAQAAAAAQGKGYSTATSAKSAKSTGKRSVTNVTTNANGTKNAVINGVQYKNQIRIV